LIEGPDRKLPSRQRSPFIAIYCEELLSHVGPDQCGLIARIGDRAGKESMTCKPHALEIDLGFCDWPREPLQFGAGVWSGNFARKCLNFFR